MTDIDWPSDYNAEEQQNIAQLWTIDPRQLDPVSLKLSCRLWLDKEESRTYKALEPALRHEYLTAHALLRIVVSRFTQTKPEKVKIYRRRFGKPWTSSAKTMPCHFNLSHTANLAAVLVSDAGPVGIDIERIDRPIDAELIAKHFGSDLMQHLLQSVPTQRRTIWLYRQWVLHEALLKAVGMGLSDRVPIQPIPLDLETGSGVYGKYQLQLFELNSSTVAATAIRSPSPLTIEICEGERLFEA